MLLLSTILTAQAQAAPANLQQIRVAQTGDQSSRIILDLDGKAQYSSFSLSEPFRYVLDLKNSQAKNVKRIFALKGTPITAVRYKGSSNGRLRVVFDLNRPVKANVQDLPKRFKRPHRIIIDLSYGAKIKAQPAPVVKPKVVRKPEKKASKAKSVVKTNNLPTKPYLIAPRKAVVVIDAGHGGKDPGATGPTGVHEKIVTLAIAKKLQSLLNKQPGVVAKLTRKRDRYVGLRQRLRIARKEKADMFVAIHADAFKNRRAKGASVFALSSRGATSESARWLAEKENYSELGGGVDLSDKSRMLRSVLIDLSQTATIGSSLQLGGAVLFQLKKITNLHSQRVEQAAFVVLKSPDIPSILVETGFLSNPSEERKLRSSSYQYKMARALERGVLHYLRAHPPNGTYFAQKKLLNGDKYRVVSGDTLSGIAEKFNTSIMTLRRMNSLSGNKLYVGQMLRVPIKRRT